MKHIPSVHTCDMQFCRQAESLQWAQGTMKPPFGRRTGDSSQEEDSAGKIPIEKWLGQEPQVQRLQNASLKCQCITFSWQQSAGRSLDSPELAESCVKPASIQSSNAALACTGHTALSRMLDTITAVHCRATCKPMMFLKCYSRLTSVQAWNSLLAFPVMMLVPLHGGRLVWEYHNILGGD